MSVDSPAAQPATPDRLIEQCLEGDQVAWEQIVRQNWRKVFNVAYKFVGKHEEAEDLTQDIFIKIFKALATFDRRANFQTWIVSISRNLCIDHYRSVRKERQTIAREVDTADLQPVSYQEIAEKLELPEGTVKSRINRGRIELARQLKRLQDKQSAQRLRGVPSRPRGRRSGV
jgi:RNA polymerase sigma-70 factor (ECF subfamily)